MWWYSKEENMEKQAYNPMGKVLVSWHGPEHLHTHPNPRAILIALGILILIVGYAVFSDNPLMAITFIMIGLVGYLFLSRDPQSRDFAITTKGITVGREIFTYDTLHSFWIFDEPPLIDVLSLKGESILAPYIHVPVPEALTKEVRDAVATYLPEEKQDPRAVDILEKMLHH